MKQISNKQQSKKPTLKKGFLLISVAPGENKVEFTRQVMENFCKHGLVLSKPK